MTKFENFVFGVDYLVEAMGEEAVADLFNENNLPEADMTLKYTWECGVENQQWDAEVRAARLSEKYYVRWLWSYEAGCDAFEICEVPNDIDELFAELREFANEAGDGPSGHGVIDLGEITFQHSVWEDIIVNGEN